MKKEILVVGGAGYIGSHMVLKLAKSKDYQPVVLDSLVYGYKKAVPKGIKFYKGDLGDPVILNEIFEAHKIKAVMHFAAFCYVGESVDHPDKYYENNVVKTITLLNSMVKNKVNNFIFSSTCATFGIPKTKKLAEDHSQLPINPYGETKLIGEKILKDYDNAYDLKYTNLRYFNAAGADPQGSIGEAHDPETHLIPLILNHLQGKRKDIKVFGENYPTRDGTCIRDYIHVLDLADAHLLALKKLIKTQKSDSYNLGTEQGNSVLEVIKMCEKVTGKKAKVINTKRRPGDPPQLVGDSKKAKKLLKWRPKYTLKEIVKHAWDWEQERKF